MSFSNLTKNIGSWTNQAITTLKDFLLKEDSFFLLKEDGGKIVIFDGSFSNQTKNSSSWTNQTRN